MNRATFGRRHHVLAAGLLMSVLPAGCAATDEPAGGNATAVELTAEETAETEVPDAGDEPVETEPSAEATPEDEPEPVGAGGQTHTFDDIGLTIHEPDEVPTDAAFALDMYVTFAKEWRWSLQEVEISEELWGITDPAAMRSLERSMDYQKDNGIHYEGELVIDMEFEDASENIVVFSACLDATDYAWIDDDGPHYIRGESGSETAAAVVTVTNNGGLWQVNEEIKEDEPC